MFVYKIFLASGSDTPTTNEETRWVLKRNLRQELFIQGKSIHSYGPCDITSLHTNLYYYYYFVSW